MQVWWDGGLLERPSNHSWTHVIGWTYGDDGLRVGKFEVRRRGGRDVDEDAGTACRC